MTSTTTASCGFRVSRGLCVCFFLSAILAAANAETEVPVPANGRLKSILAGEIKFQPIDKNPKVAPAPKSEPESGSVTNSSALTPTPAPRPRLSAEHEAKIREARAKAKPVEAPRDTAEPADVVLLDKMEVMEKRDTFVQDRLAELQERKERAMRHTETSSLDEVLNHPKLAIFGAYSSVNRVAQAKGAINAMEFERLILLAIEFAETETERAKLKRLLLEVRYGLRQR